MALLQSWSACVPVTGLLRNDRVTQLSPVTPALATLLPLDPVADLYRASFPAGSLDPDVTVLGDRNRPLVFYALPGAGVVKVVKSGTSIRVIY